MYVNDPLCVCDYSTTQEHDALSADANQLTQVHYMITLTSLQFLSASLTPSAALEDKQTFLFSLYQVSTQTSQATKQVTEKAAITYQRISPHNTLRYNTTITLAQ